MNFWRKNSERLFTESLLFWRAQTSLEFNKSHHSVLYIGLKALVPVTVGPRREQHRGGVLPGCMAGIKMTTMVTRFKMTMVTGIKMTMVTGIKMTMVPRCSPIHLVKHATAWSSDISSNCFRSQRSICCLRFYLKQRVPPICLCALVIVRVCASCVSFHKISYFLPDETVLCWLSPVVAKARCNQVFSAKSL